MNECVSNNAAELVMASMSNNDVHAPRLCAKRSYGIDGKAIFVSFFVEWKGLRERQRILNTTNEKLVKTADVYKKGLRKPKEQCFVSKFLKAVQEAKEGNTKAVLLLDQVKNYKRKKPQWSETTVRHCIILRNLSAKAYEYMRLEELLGLPCRNTLQIHWHCFWRSWVE